MADTYEATAGKRLFSSFVGVLARLGVGNFALLTTTGRRSGRSRTVTIAPISEGGIDYLVSPYGESAWVRNLRADPEAKLRPEVIRGWCSGTTSVRPSPVDSWMSRPTPPSTTSWRRRRDSRSSASRIVDAILVIHRSNGEAVHLGDDN
jgi:deazaflavin-dependent oxidoreductase (nitroreductase family)